MQNTLHFGQWLMRAVEDTGLTRSEFCRRAGIPIPTLFRWKRLQCPPIRAHNLVRLARTLGIPREEIEAKLEESKTSSAPELPTEAVA